MGWFLLLLCLIALVSVLAWGVISMGMGGKYNTKWSNKIMRYRVVLQALALLVFVALLSFKIFSLSISSVFCPCNASIISDELLLVSLLSS